MDNPNYCKALTERLRRIDPGFKYLKWGASELSKCGFSQALLPQL
jgi:hypothetical protein